MLGQKPMPMLGQKRRRRRPKSRLKQKQRVGKRRRSYAKANCKAEGRIVSMSYIWQASAAASSVPRRGPGSLGSGWFGTSGLRPYVLPSVSLISFRYYSLYLNCFAFLFRNTWTFTPSRSMIVPEVRPTSGTRRTISTSILVFSVSHILRLLANPSTVSPKQ